MPGESTIPFIQYPDSFHVIHMTFQVAPSTSTGIPLMYVEPRSGAGKDGLVVDSVQAVVSAAAAGVTLQLQHTSNPDGTTGATAIMSSTISCATTGIKEGTVDQANNFVPSGNILFAKFAGTTTGLLCSLQVRLRSRLK